MSRDGWLPSGGEKRTEVSPVSAALIRVYEEKLTYKNTLSLCTVIKEYLMCRGVKVH